MQHWIPIWIMACHMSCAPVDGTSLLYRYPLCGQLYRQSVPCLSVPCLSVPCLSVSCLSECQQEITKIDAMVLELIDLRNKELAHAAWAQNQGDRLQFQPQYLLDARRYWHEAEDSREMAARYQLEINQLEHRKEELRNKEGAP